MQVSPLQLIRNQWPDHAGKILVLDVPDLYEAREVELRSPRPKDPAAHRETERLNPRCPAPLGFCGMRARVAVKSQCVGADHAIVMPWRGNVQKFSASMLQTAGVALVASGGDAAAGAAGWSNPFVRAEQANYRVATDVGARRVISLWAAMTLERRRRRANRSASAREDATLRTI